MVALIFLYIVGLDHTATSPNPPKGSSNITVPSLFHLTYWGGVGASGCST